MPLPPSGSITTTASSRLWQPIALRSVLTLAFGLLTVFWGAPDVVGMSLLLALYLAAVAAAQFWFVRRLALPAAGSRGVALLVPAALAAVAAVVIFFSTNESAAGWLGGTALVLLGVGELFAALSSRGRFALRSDWMISAAIGLATGILLPFFIPLGAHALLGVAGGGALMTGALWLLSALSLRHDARKPAKAVN